jgi:hypothetical protein
MSDGPREISTKRVNVERYGEREGWSERGTERETSTEK